MERTIGIDLGTTNSCAAFFENGESVIIPTPEGKRTMPSVVSFAKTGERLVGDVAKRQAVTNAERTIMSIKRDMGTNNRRAIDGKSYTPQEIQRDDSAKTENQCGRLPWRNGNKRCDYRTGLFQRCAETSDEGCR